VECNDRSASEHVVLELGEPILGKECTLYFDNWCSSPKLYVELHQRRMIALGTVRSNRKEMPKHSVKKKLKQE
jgi:hypothetical protein